MDSGRPTRTKILLTGTDPTNPKGGIGVAMSGYASALRAAGLDYTLIPSYRPDVVGGRWWWAIRAGGQIWAMARRLRRQGVTPVVYAHGGRVLGLIRQALLLYLARAAGARTMLHLHSIAVDSYVRSRHGRAFLRLCLFPAERVCVLSPWWRPRLDAVRPADELVVVPNPLPAELERIARDQDHAPARAPDACMHLLTMARMVPGKGVDHAIRTMSVLPDDVTLTVAGDGSERRTCERLARTLGLTGRVRFVGWVDGAEKAKLLVTCHALLLPSQYDAFGTVFLEAMAHGLPVVASHAGPMADVVPDGIAGILVEGHDPTTLAEAVMRLTNESLRSSLGRGGKDWVRRVCGVAVVGESLRATVEGLTKR